MILLGYALLIVRIVCLILILIGSVAFAQTQTQTQSQPQTDEAPPDTEIFLFPFDGNAIKVDQIRNITSREGYDNQPSFFPDGQKLFYTSIRDSKQADIFLYELANQKTTQITSTEESEYSPTVMPDGKFFSTVRVEKDETQRLWKFPIGGGGDGERPELILREIKPVGYHAWLNSNSVALFILGEPPTLQVADVTSGKARVVASNIGRGMSKIPGKQSLSFVSKETETKWTLKEWDPSTGETKELATTLPESEDIGWTPDGILLSASGSKLYRLSAEKQWQEIADLAAKGLSRITRIAVSPKGNWIAIVSEMR